MYVLFIQAAFETLHSDSGTLNSGDTRMNEQNDEGWKHMRAVNLSQYLVLGQSLVPFPVCPRQGLVPKVLDPGQPLSVAPLFQQVSTRLWGTFCGRNTLLSVSGNGR